MKRIVFCAVCLWLMLMAAPTGAQDAKDCGTDSINSQMNELVASYSLAQAKATDADGALAAANDLQTHIAALTTACANGSPEATAEPPSTGVAIEGKWMLTWQEKTKSCPAENMVTVLVDRPVILQMSKDSKTLLFDTLFWFGKAEFEVAENGTYRFIRSGTDNSGNHFSFTYVLSDLKSNSMTGTSTDYYPKSSCPSLKTDFTLTLVDPNVICMVGSQSAVNLRSGPGTTFDRSGTLDPNKAVDVVGYALSTDGSNWWKLASGGWVRSNLVQEVGLCDKVPETKA